MRRWAVLLICLAGCSGEASTLGLGEPIRVVGGTFKPGELPGAPPLVGAEIDAGVTPSGSHVTVLESVNNVVRPGQAAKGITGRVTSDASSIGLRLADLGSGFWVVPAEAPDPAVPGELTWALKLDVAQDVPAGLHPLRFAGIDESGSSGTQAELTICVTSPIPDNLNSCDPSIDPPAAVLSLTWDTDVDLDLQLVTPTGKVVDAKHPTTAPIVDGGVTPGPADGALDHDSNAGCSIDAARRESIVWQQKPANGQYLVYANLFSACGQGAVRFTATLHLSQPTGEHQALVEVLRVSGELLAQDANGGARPGLFVSEFFIQ